MNPVSASANCMAPPSVASDKILSEEGLKFWWIGNLKVTSIDANWPALGSNMVWDAGGGTFSAQVTKDNRPYSSELKVSTPSADSIIVNSFEVLPNGGTRYTKSVEPIFRTRMTRFFGPLFVFILRKFVNTEVKRAAAFADL